MKIADEPHQGWSSVINEDPVTTLRVLIEENWNITFAEIEQYFWNVACDFLSQGTVYQNHPSLSLYEKNLGKMGYKTVGW